MRCDLCDNPVYGDPKSMLCDNCYFRLRESDPKTMNSDELMALCRIVVLTRKEPSPHEREQQRRDWAYGNVKLSNPKITRDMIDKAAIDVGSGCSCSECIPPKGRKWNG